ncbi:uncharacterized protein LOC122659364 [Telopea speciosissima]|uniref:uncharacterized protein LOC122659364 n=1 Tax=Telopea speciosissima TaxID=54955 RepID=UPI001CC7A23C|nr:uncharacterized protein LOC122659364 [Telopea speciosissima]
MAFKSCYEISDDDEELSNDEIAYLSKKFLRFLKNKGRTSFNKRRFSKDQKGKSVSKDNTDSSSKDIVCFECRKSGYYKRDCPKIKKYKKTHKVEHSFDLSDEKEEDEESQEEEQTNLALMALEDESGQLGDMRESRDYHEKCNCNQVEENRHFRRQLAIARITPAPFVPHSDESSDDEGYADDDEDEVVPDVETLSFSDEN